MRKRPCIYLMRSVSELFGDGYALDFRDGRDAFSDLGMAAHSDVLDAFLNANLLELVRRRAAEDSRPNIFRDRHQLIERHASLVPLAVALVAALALHGRGFG